MLHVQFIPIEFISWSNNITQIRGFWSTWTSFGTLFGSLWVFWGSSSLFSGPTCLLETRSSSVRNISKIFHQYCKFGSWLMFILAHAWWFMLVEIRCVRSHTRAILSILERVANPFEWSSRSLSLYIECMWRGSLSLIPLSQTSWLREIEALNPMGECLSQRFPNINTR